MPNHLAINCTAKSFFNTWRKAIKHFDTNGHSLINGIEIRYILPPGYVSVRRLPAGSRNDEQEPLFVVMTGCSGCTGESIWSSSSKFASDWLDGSRLLRRGNDDPNGVPRFRLAVIVERTPPTCTLPITFGPVYSSRVPHGARTAIIFMRCNHWVQYLCVCLVKYTHIETNSIFGRDTGDHAKYLSVGRVGFFQSSQL